MLKLLIADDHPFFRKGLRYVVQGVPSLEIVGEASDGETALRMVEELHPDIIILDVEMPRCDGFEVARTIRARKYPVEMIFLTMHKEESILRRMVEFGVKGYLLKDNATEDLLECIDAVSRGEYYVSPFLSNHLMRVTKRSTGSSDIEQAIHTLTETELSVLQFIGEHKTSREIGEILFVSEKTVEKHRSNIARKLNLRGSHALLKFAAEHKSKL